MISRTPGENTVHDAVVKSCNRVPTASTTSASAASAFADADPVMPNGPACNGCSCGTSVRPAVVSVTGMPCSSANRNASAAAPEYRTPPPSTSSGRSAASSTRAAAASASTSGRVRSGRWSTVANNASGKSNASACTSCGSARVTGPQSAGSVSTRATWGSVAIAARAG